MGRTGFQRTYTVEQERAIREACTTYGMTAKEAVAAAAADRGGALAGKCALPGPGASLPPFTIGQATAAGYASDERRRREVEAATRANPAAVAQSATGRLAALLETEIGKAERRSRGGRKPVDPAHIGALAKAARELQALAKATGQHNAVTSVPEGDAPADPADDFVGALATRIPAP